MMNAYRIHFEPVTCWFWRFNSPSNSCEKVCMCQILTTFPGEIPKVLVAYINHHSIGSKPSFWHFFWSTSNLWKIIGSNSNSFVICWIKFHYFNDFLWRTSHFAMLFQGTGTTFGCPRTLPWHCLCERFQPLRNWALNTNAVSSVWR